MSNAMRVLPFQTFGAGRGLHCPPLKRTTRIISAAAEPGVRWTAPKSNGKQPDDFDSFELDESYYKQVGISPEEAQEDLDALIGEDLDEDGNPIEEDEDDNDDDVGDGEPLMGTWGDFEKEPQQGEIEILAGPPAVLLAGFRDHEFGMVRATLDSVGYHDVRVIPCRGKMLYLTIEQAWATPEPDWSAPKLEKAWSGAFGSQRTVVFSGLSESDVLTILELVEVGGMPQLMVALATEEIRSRVLGEVLAETIQEQRRQRQKAKPVEVDLATELGSSAVVPEPKQAASSSPIQPASQETSTSSREAGLGEAAAQQAAPAEAVRPPSVSPLPQDGGAAELQSPEPSRGPTADAPSREETQSTSTSPPGEASKARTEPSLAGNRFVPEIESNEFASQQRAMREEAAREMERRAAAARAGGDAMPADNLIDAVAAGENLETMLKAGSPKSVKDVETLKAEQEEVARQKMEEVLARLKADAATMPEAERKKAAHELRMLASDKEAIGKVLSDMGKDLDSIPKDDREEVKSKLRQEAWQPTKDAIGAALACGITADEVRGFVDEAERDRAENRGGWHPKVMDTVEQ